MRITEGLDGMNSELQKITRYFYAGRKKARLVLASLARVPRFSPLLTLMS
jgi:hypothetical protein